jgi:hypothetical protein
MSMAEPSLTIPALPQTERDGRKIKGAVPDKPA